jgi:hypothetical protein
MSLVQEESGWHWAVSGLRDVTVGSRVKVINDNGSIRYTKGTVWEQIPNKDKNLPQLQIDIKYAKEHGLRGLNLPRMNYKV